MDDDGDAVETVCEVQQRVRREPTDGGEVSITEWVGYFLPEDTIGTADTVELDDLGTFRVEGAPWIARDPLTQSDSHLEATLAQIRGAGE